MAKCTPGQGIVGFPTGFVTATRPKILGIREDRLPTAACDTRSSTRSRREICGVDAMLTRVCVAYGLLLALLTAFGQKSQAAEWGSIEGQFVVDGKIDVPALYKKGDPTVKDPEVCGIVDLPDDSLVINPANGGIANIFIYLNKAPADIHPSLKAVPTTKMTFDQKGCRYLPRAMVVRVGQAVSCVSSDNAAHNIHTVPIAGNAENFIVQPNDKTGKEVVFQIKESLPIPVVCDIHSFMKANWAVVDHPYAVVTDADGKYKIENLPAGEHEFRVWQERQGYLNRKYMVKVVAGKTTTLPVEKVPVEKLSEKKK